MVFWRGVQKFRKIVIPSGCNHEVQSGGTFTFSGTASNTLIKVARLSIVKGQAGLATGLTVAVVPAGAVILGASVRVTEAWNTGGSPATAVLDMGWGGSLNEIAAAEDVKSTGLKTIESILPTAIETTATTVKVKVVENGSAATTGKAEIHLWYTA